MTKLQSIITTLRRQATLLAIAIAAPCLTVHAADGVKYTPAVSHFAWGAEAGASVDLTSNDMSTATIAAYFGYRSSWIDVLGVGAQVSTMVSESNRAFPVYALFRSNFRQRPSVCFLNLKVGVVFNNLGYHENQTGFFASPALGFNLASGTKFQSYLLVGYEFNGMRPFSTAHSHINIHGLHMGTIGLGIAF